MKTIPELQRELEDAKLANERRLGLRKAKEIKKEIFELRHPHIINAGKRIKAVGRATGRDLIKTGKQASEGIKPYAKAIQRSNQGRHGFDKSIYNKHRKLKTKIKTKKHKLKKVHRVQRQSYSNPYSMFG